MAGSNAAGALALLARIARHYAPGLGTRKLPLLRLLSRANLPTARQVLRLHELLCFLDAYADDRRVRILVRRMLNGFRNRPDLRRHRVSLAGTGIAGTDTRYRFFWPTARWISQNWPGALVLDREDPDHEQAILEALPQLLEPIHAEYLRKQAAPTLEILDRLRPQAITDADYFIGLVAAMPGDDITREAFFDRVDPPLILRAGRTTPERTTARFDRLAVHYRSAPLKIPRPDLRQEAEHPPRRILPLRDRDAEAAIRLARISMITRERDLAVFQFANPRDAFLVDDGQSLAFAMMGTLPERRALLPAIYGGLTLQNGVPIGYVQVDVLGRHAELSFNTFETFRNGEAARVFARLVAAVHHVFHCDSFSVEPYQLGAGNEEGIESGAWWFYHRFGFRPRAAAARRLAASEIRRIARDRRHRSSRRTLRVLARAHLYYSLAPARRASLPRIHALHEAGTRELRRFGQADAVERRAAAVTAAKRRLAASESYRPGKDTLRMLGRWAGIVLALTARGRWSAGERRQLLRLIEAKSDTDERRYLRRLLRLQRLRCYLDC
ncbi:MAG: hypothetical protein ACRETI_07060 [Steroidobacteraceae bacterium]